ncbi:hypothetical protein [Rhizobium sp. SL86]|uniref:hypothetical protein n=1 Tax=Rhizobium sp. SL86 TaxID=2995148 RepID=UPI00227425C8|nr:hypothetical protein [Rhizobium sp. SL86]MCY1668487.1 hypothetical protein [Rhizobium sp. SL86]
MEQKAKKRRFGVDPATGRLNLGIVETPLPRSKAGRIVIGAGLVGGGVLGFLPVLGFWMVPVGLLVLSQDLGFVRRGRRRVTLWWARRRQGRRG